MGVLRPFVSYASEDRPAVQAFVKKLQVHGVDVWIDVEQIQPGDDLIDRLNEGLGGSGAAILFSSVHYWKKQYPSTESKALTHLTISDSNHRLIIVRLDESEIPPLLAHKIHVRPDEDERVAHALGAFAPAGPTVPEIREQEVSLARVDSDDIEEIARTIISEAKKILRGEAQSHVRCFLMELGEVRIELREAAVTDHRVDALLHALDLCEIHARYVKDLRDELVKGGLGIYKTGFAIRLEDKLAALEEVRSEQVRPLIDAFIQSVRRIDP